MSDCKECGVPTVWRDQVCTDCKRDAGLTELEIMRLSSPATTGRVYRIT